MPGVPMPQQQISQFVMPNQMQQMLYASQVNHMYAMHASNHHHPMNSMGAMNMNMGGGPPNMARMGPQQQYAMGMGMNNMFSAPVQSQMKLSKSWTLVEKQLIFECLPLHGHGEWDVLASKVFKPENELRTYFRLLYIRKGISVSSNASVI